MSTPKSPPKTAREAIRKSRVTRVLSMKEWSEKIGFSYSATRHAIKALQADGYLIPVGDLGFRKADGPLKDPERAEAANLTANDLATMKAKAAPVEPEPDLRPPPPYSLTVDAEGDSTVTFVLNGWKMRVCRYEVVAIHDASGDLTHHQPDAGEADVEVVEEVLVEDVGVPEGVFRRFMARRFGRKSAEVEAVEEGGDDA